MIWLLWLLGYVVLYVVLEDRRARREERAASWARVGRRLGWDVASGMLFIELAHLVGWTMAAIVVGVGAAVVAVALSFVRSVIREARDGRR